MGAEAGARDSGLGAGAGGGRKRVVREKAGFLWLRQVHAPRPTLHAPRPTLGRPGRQPRHGEAWHMASDRTFRPA